MCVFGENVTARSTDKAILGVGWKAIWQSVIWHRYGENLRPLLQSTVLATAGGEKAAGL